jgi:hypothetical protein
VEECIGERLLRKAARRRVQVVSGARQYPLSIRSSASSISVCSTNKQVRKLQ